MNIIHLSNGLILAYAEYGDLGGRPVFFFHGIPGSRFFHPSDEITQRMGVRLICMDRPGYGESGFQPARRILDWPGYVTSLADHLNIGTFSVASHSGGGPFALACSYALPERVRSAAIVSSLGPVGSYEDMQLLIPVNRIALKFGQHIPWWLLYLFLKLPTAKAGGFLEKHAQVQLLSKSFPRTTNDRATASRLRSPDVALPP